MKNKKRQFKLFILILSVMGSFLLSENLVFASEITPENIFKLVNKERIKYKLPPLVKNNKLNQAASYKVSDLLEKNYFAHSSPKGKKFFEWIDEENYNYLYAGENLAMDFITAEGIIKAWMKSKSHRDNILSNNYIETGISVKAGFFKDHPTIIVSQLFGTPKSSPLTPTLTENNINAILNTKIKTQKNNPLIAGVKIKKNNAFNNLIITLLSLFLIILSTTIAVQNINFVYYLKILSPKKLIYTKYICIK
jgi:hypothetical protein